MLAGCVEGDAIWLRYATKLINSGLACGMSRQTRFNYSSAREGLIEDKFHPFLAFVNFDAFLNFSIVITNQLTNQLTD
jgi:hypothetical protein